MLAPSTTALIQYKTGPMQQSGIVPCRLRSDFDPHRLQAVLVWLAALVMTIELAISETQEMIEQTLFITTMAFIVTRISFSELRSYVLV